MHKIEKARSTRRHADEDLMVLAGRVDFGTGHEMLVHAETGHIERITP